jgi:SAM-dependent methyltransferase
MPKPKVKDFYEKYPFPNLQPKNKQELMLTIKPILQSVNLKPEELKGKKVIDFGCGTGEKTVAFAEYCKKAVGVDFSDASLKAAESLSKKFSRDNTEFIKADLEGTVDFGKFDLVVSSGVLHHLSNPFNGFLICVEHTKNGGLLAVQVYNKYGRFLSNVKMAIANRLPEKYRADFAKLVCRANNPAIVADYLFHPRETTMAISKLLKWFDECDFQFENAYRPISLSNYIYLLKNKGKGFVLLPKKKGNAIEHMIIQLCYWLPRERTLFIVGGRKMQNK